MACPRIRSCYVDQVRQYRYGARVASSRPFVGRAGVLARAEAIFASHAGVLLLGEAGIGKTALARRLAERAAREDMAVIQVVGRAVSSGAPFEAFAGVLTGEGSPGPAPGGSGQVTAADVAARVAATAEGAWLLVVVDDVDLLDDGSARVLLHLASAARLHISARTVQTHLAHVYAKLGINRRADLASQLSDE